MCRMRFSIRKILRRVSSRLSLAKSMQCGYGAVETVRGSRPSRVAPTALVILFAIFPELPLRANLCRAAGAGLR
jgi:hypothetical protein